MLFPPKGLSIMLLRRQFPFPGIFKDLKFHVDASRDDSCFQEHSSTSNLMSPCSALASLKAKIDSSELREALLSLGFVVSPMVLDLLVSKFDNTGGKSKAIEYDNFIEYSFATCPISLSMILLHIPFKFCMYDTLLD
ncbi:hypothetical protein K1719_047595 [Acacia pycnantha]|nr:hypothetical protein K1719_047595 [Acacia pycnantha]